MENRYLFRAKCNDNGEWVEGLLTIMWGQLHVINPNDENTAYPIDQSTICQCTGRTDENKTMIFEHDIVGYLDCTSTESGYSERGCVGEVTWDDETLSFQVSGRLCAESYEVLSGIDCKVIGNIFDNPELLEVECGTGCTRGRKVE